MRKILAAIRRIAAMMVLPVVAFVDGAWRVVQALRPQPSTALEDAADDVLDEVPASRPAARESYDEMKAKAATGEEARVRQAAQMLLRREPIPTTVLDPSRERDARILSWLRTLDVMELATLVSLKPQRLEQHLAGRPGAPLPPMREPAPAADDVVVEFRPAEPATRRRAA